MEESFSSIVNRYVRENKGTSLAVTGSGAILGWWLAKTMTGVVLGGIAAPLLVAYGVTKYTNKVVA